VRTGAFLRAEATSGTFQDLFQIDMHLRQQHEPKDHKDIDRRTLAGTTSKPAQASGHCQWQTGGLRPVDGKHC